MSFLPGVTNPFGAFSDLIFGASKTAGGPGTVTSATSTTARRGAQGYQAVTAEDPDALKPKIEEKEDKGPPHGFVGEGTQTIPHAAPAFARGSSMYNFEGPMDIPTPEQLMQRLQAALWGAL